ncbi:MAG: hypothetical protein ACYSR9_11535 [Planctomycetota bacterium]|jgi:hypothetical protein
MRFKRVYPIEFWIIGKSESKDNLEKYLKQDKPDVIVKGIKEEIRGFDEDNENSLYKITGYSTNPNVR